MKTNIIQNIQNKKANSSRNELIDNLKKKMEKNNTSDLKDLYQVQAQAEDQEALYNRELDDFNTNNYVEEKKNNYLNKEQSRKCFVKELKEVIEESDVILQVLDARDPMN